MDIKEINKQLEKKDLDPSLRKSLEKKKEILTADKIVRKCM